MEVTFTSRTRLGLRNLFPSLTCVLVCISLLAGAGNTHALNGTVQAVSFTGPVTGQTVTFSLYLPPGYNGSTNRYPLIIHLHGIGGTHNGGQISTVPESHEDAVAAGLIEPCIIAFPDGYSDSFWANSANSFKPAETNVRQEIIPYLDANYRTLATRNRRAVQGFSMGGFGAAKFAAKFPELFSACVIYDGAMLSWTQVQQRHPVQTTEIFNNDAATFSQFSPWHWLTQNVATLRASLPFRDSQGSLTNENRAWRDALLAQSVSITYVETGLPHQLGPLLDAQGSNSWAFIAAAFAQADAGSNGSALLISRQGQNMVLRWPSEPEIFFRVEHGTNLSPPVAWSLLVTNLPASGGAFTEFTHTNALLKPAGFYRVSPATSAPPSFVFDWSGTNFTYTDASRTFTGIMLKPVGVGPFPAAIINHGAGGTATGYSLTKAREMLAWGMVCIGPALTHVANGETNPFAMGHCPENTARAVACANVLASLSYVDTNRIAILGHSMGAFASIGDAAALTNRLRAGVITAGGVIPDSAGTNNAAPTVTEAIPVQTPFLMLHCDADPVVPAVRSQLFQQILVTNGVANQRIVISSNSIPNQANWHNLHQDANINTMILTNVQQWFQTHGVLP